MEISEVKVRNEFFVSALFVESTITDYLSDKIETKNIGDSEVGQKKFKNLTFIQRIETLMEVVNFSISELIKLSVFRDIYKEFIANASSPTLEESFTSADHNDDFLLILYPQNDYLPREEKLMNACYQLIGEVSELVAEHTNKPEVKMTRRNRFFNIDTLKVGKFAMLFSFLMISS